MFVGELTPVPSLYQAPLRLTHGDSPPRHPGIGPPVRQCLGRLVLYQQPYALTHERFHCVMARPAPRLSGSFLLYKAHGLDSTWSDAFSDASDMSRSRAVPHQNTVFRQLANRLPWAALERATAE